MGKKKPANKKTTSTTPAIPQATNGGSSDVTSPTTSSFAKEDQKDSSEPTQDEIKNATTPTEGTSTSHAATTADTPAVPLSKGQKKKAAAARKAAAAAALANDTPPSQPATPEEVGTPAEPVDDSEANANVTKPLVDGPETSKPLENTPAPEPEEDPEGDAWGLNEGESPVVDHGVTKPAADEAPAPSAEDSSSADGVQVAAVEPKLEDTTPKDISSGDQASESVPPPPGGGSSSDASPNPSNPSPDTSDLLETKNDLVIPSGEIAVDEHPPNEDTTKPNGTFNCEPMDLPPRPSDDDNTPLSQFAGREKPIVDTSFVSDSLANGGGGKQTPSSAGENLGSAPSGSNSNTSGIGLFSNSPSRPNAPSTSPTISGVPARGPVAVGFGSAAPPQTPTTTPGFGFGFGSQKSTPKTASGMSWSPSTPSKPAAKPWSWGNISGFANKAREAVEQAINDEPSRPPPPSSRAPPARSPSVDRPAPSPAVGPSNPNSDPNVTPASPTTRPTKGMTAFEMRMAALGKKATAGADKEKSPEPKPETPKASSSVIPPSDSGASPISPSQPTQSQHQSHPLPLPLPPSTSTPAEQNALQTPDQARVTSAFPSPPRETMAETGNVGKLIAKFDHPEAPISSKTATTGLRLHTEPAVPDGRQSESPVTKRDSIGSETERPSPADMRSSLALGPRTPITSASPKTPATFSFGPGLGTNRINGGRFAFGGGGFGGLRPNPGPSSMSTPVKEENETKFKRQQDLDDVSSVVEGSEPTDLDSQIGESEAQDLDSLVDEPEVPALPDFSINIESPTIPTTFNATIPDVAPAIKNPWDVSPVPVTEALPVITPEATAPLPSPTRSEAGSEPEPEVAIPDDKTIGDLSDLADLEPEPASKDEPQVESPVASEPAVTPVAEKPVAPIAEEAVPTPVVAKPLAPSVVEEPAVARVPHEEAATSESESTERAVEPEPQVDEPPPEISAEKTPEPASEAVESTVEPIAEEVVGPVVGPTVESTVESTVELATEPTPGPTVEPVTEPTSESIPEPSEPTVESIVEPAVEAPVESASEPLVETPLEPTPGPVVELAAEPPVEPTPVPEPVPGPVAIVSTLEPSIESTSQPLPPSPIEIEPPVAESIPVVPVEAPAEKPAPPKLTLDVPQADDSPKPKSPLPPTPATPVTPAASSKKKKKKGKKGGAGASEPASAIPETISEPTPQSEPASKSEPVSRFVPEFSPVKVEVEPIQEAKVEIATPTPIELKAEPISEVAESTPTVEVPPTPETPKEPEPTPVVVEEAKPKEEPTKSKKSKHKKKRKSSTAPTQVTSPIDDVPPTPVEQLELPEAKVVEVPKPVVSEPAVVEPVATEPVVVEPVVVEPTPVEPTPVEPTPVELASVESASVEPAPVEPAPVEPASVEPVVIEPVAIKPVMAEPIMVESVFEAAPPPAVEEPTKSEDNRTAVPDEGFETPKIDPQELPDLAPVPVEAAPQSPVVEMPAEPIIIPPPEPVSEPILVPLSTEAYPEFIPTLKAQPELEPGPIVESVVEPIVDPVEAGIEPPVEVVPEISTESIHELVPEFSAPTVESIAELTLAPPTEEITIEEIPPVAESVPELEVQSPTEPVAEVAALPVVEAPREEVPVPEVKDTNPSPSKSSRKKNKKGAAKAAVVMEEPAPSWFNDEPVVEVVRPEVPIASLVEENKVTEEIAVIPSPTTSKKKNGKKSEAISLAPTPIEKAPTLPLPVEAPSAPVDTPQLEEIEEAPVTVTPQVEPLESPVQTEATPKIEVIELPDYQDADAVSIISVAQMPHDVATPIQLPTFELAPTELVPEVLPEPEPVPVLVDLPQSPVASAPSVFSSPRPIVLSPRPEEAFLATREASPPPRSVTPDTDKHHETLEVSQIPAISPPSPISPALKHIVSAEVTAPFSASPVSESASQSSRDIGSFEREASIVPQESHSLRRTGSASSITSIDTDSPSTVEKATMRSSMPPLISVPIPSPITTSNPSFDLAIKQHAAQPEPNPTIVEGPASSAVTNDSPTNDLPPKSDTIPKPSSSKIGFSPLRWFGFGGSSSPAVENKPVEVKPVEVKPVEVEPVEVRPIEVKAAETNPVEIKPVEVTPVEVMPVEVKPVEVVKSVEAKPAEMKPVEVKTAEAKPAEINPAERKPVEIEPVEVKHIIVHPVPVKPVEAPATAPSQSSKVVEGREKQPKVTLVPIRKAASPSSPDSPAVEKTTWSRWPYQPAVITSIPPVRPRVPLARDSVPIPARSDGQAVPPRPGRVPPVSTMPPIIPITPISAVSPPTPAKADPAHSRRSHRTNGASLPTLPTLVHTQDTSTHKEKKERSAKRPSATARAPSPTPDIPDVAFQSPRSSEDSLPAYTPQAPNVDRDPKPAPRGILKQRITPPTTPPEAETPIATDPTRAVPQVSKFEFMGSRNVPTYDDWGHAPPVRKDVLSNTSAPRSREAQPPSPMTPPPSSRSRTTGDSIHRSRSKHSLKELGSVPNKVNHPRTPSPSPPRETKATPKTTVTPPKPNLVPVLNEKIIRTKAPKPAKISTTRNTGDVHTQPLISPILLTSENYGARLPENKVYQYDGISPSESLSPTIRKAIFDTLQKQVAPQVFPVLARPSFDGKKMLYVHKRLNVSSRQEFSVELPEDGQEPQVYIVQLKRIAVITPQIALDFR